MSERDSIRETGNGRESQPKFHLHVVRSAFLVESGPEISLPAEYIKGMIPLPKNQAHDVSPWSTTDAYPVGLGRVCTVEVLPEFVPRRLNSNSSEQLLSDYNESLSNLGISLASELEVVSKEPGTVPSGLLPNY